MPGKDLHQPHDRLIKYTYGRKAAMAAFLEGYLPTELTSGINWNHLRLMPGSFMDATLSDLHSDILYEVEFHQKPLLMHCLFEHQSSCDSWIGLRLLDYKAAIWRAILKTQTEGQPKFEKLPPIYPIVLYSGKERWTTPRRWIEKLDIPQSAASVLVKHQPDFEYQLVDLSHLSAEEIRGDVAGRLTLGLMKAAAEDRVLEWLEQAGPLLNLLQKREVTGMFEALLRYLLAVDSSVTREKVFATIERSAAPELTQQAMSIADQLIEEGRTEGRQEGRKEGKWIGGIIALQELLGVPVSAEEELASRSTADLQLLLGELRARAAKS